MDAKVVLGKTDVAEFVLGAPGARERRLGLVDGRVEPPQLLVQLLFLLVQSRVPVNDDRHQKATSRLRLSGHGGDREHDSGLSTKREQARAADGLSVPSLFVKSLEMRHSQSCFSPAANQANALRSTSTGAQADISVYNDEKRE